MSECKYCQDQREHKDMPSMIDGLCLWCRQIEEKEKRIAELVASKQKWKHIAIKADSLETRTVAYVELKKEKDKRIAELEDKLNRIKAEVRCTAVYMNGGGMHSVPVSGANKIMEILEEGGAD